MIIKNVIWIFNTLSILYCNLTDLLGTDRDNQKFYTLTTLYWNFFYDNVINI